MNKQNRSLLVSAALLIAAAAFTRLFPHAPNFTAIGAIALFGGMTINDKRLAFVLPLAAMLLSDICLQLFTTTPGFYGVGQFFVYGAFVLITAIATTIQKRSATNIAFAAVWSGVIFFILSNVGVWLTGDYYAKNLSGFATCLYAALPFYKNELFGNFLLNGIMGNAFYSAVLFGLYAAAEKRYNEQPAIA